MGVHLADLIGANMPSRMMNRPTSHPCWQQPEHRVLMDKEKITDPIFGFAFYTCTNATSLQERWSRLWRPNTEITNALGKPTRDDSCYLGDTVS